MPGVGLDSATDLGARYAWRKGARWRVWRADGTTAGTDGTTGASAARARIDLQDAVTVAALRNSTREEEAAEAFDETGMLVALTGRTLRLTNADPSRVRAILESKGLSAELRVLPATFEEAFASITVDASA